MIQSFTSQGSECLIEGVLYDADSSYNSYAYDKQVAVSEPALERCSEICKAQNIQYLHSAKINQLTILQTFPCLTAKCSRILCLTLLVGLNIMLEERSSVKLRNIQLLMA